jgi:hypothetical protein
MPQISESSYQKFDTGFDTGFDVEFDIEFTEHRPQVIALRADFEVRPQSVYPNRLLSRLHKMRIPIRSSYSRSSGNDDKLLKIYSFWNLLKALEDCFKALGISAYSP